MTSETMKTNRVLIGVDGNAGFALLGENIQEGECEFVVVEKRKDEHLADTQKRAATQAYRKLCARLNDGLPLPYMLDDYYPGVPR